MQWPNPSREHTKALQVDHEEEKKYFECEIKKLIINQAMCVKIIGLLDVVKRSKLLIKHIHPFFSKTSTKTSLEVAAISCSTR